MVRVLITWADGDTEEIDLSQAAIDFYRQQGVIIRIIDQTNVTDRDIILRIDSSKSGIINNFVSISYMITKGANFSEVINPITIKVFEGRTLIHQRTVTIPSGQSVLKNIKFPFSRTRLTGQLIANSRTGLRVAQPVDFDFQAIPPREPSPPFEPPIGDDDLPPIEEDTGRNLFQSAIIGVLALGVIGGSLLDDKPNKRRKR